MFRPMAAVNAGQVLTVRRKLVLPTVAPDDELANLNRFGVGDAPLFKTQTVGTKYDEESVRRKRSRASISCRYLKNYFQWITLNNSNSKVVLGEEVGAVVTHGEMRDVAFELWRKFLLPQ